MLLFISYYFNVQVAGVKGFENMYMVRGSDGGWWPWKPRNIFIFNKKNLHEFIKNVFFGYVNSNVQSGKQT